MEEQNTTETECQKLTKEVLTVLKGKRTDLCKMVLKQLLEEGLDYKSLVQ